MPVFRRRICAAPGALLLTAPDADSPARIRWAALDLDGTVIGPDERITDGTLAAVRELAAAVPVLLATGREPGDVLRYSRQLGLSTPQVGDGGAAIIDPVSGRHLWHSTLGAALAERIVRRLDAMGAAFVATHTGGAWWSLEQVAAWEAVIRISALDLTPETAEALDAFFRNEAGRNDTEDSVSGGVSGDGAAGGGASGDGAAGGGNSGLHTVKAALPYNGLWAVDFTTEGVDKATGAARAGEMLGGLPLADLAAVGDSYNDLPLLRQCGLPIAMGNAPSIVRNAARHTAPPVEDDGLAYAIRQWILPAVGAG